MDGLLNLDKPAGMTSRDVVDHVARLVKPDKAGHAGTLDPLATGVLIVCVGQATRLIEYLHGMPKQYTATFLLGRRSDTDDIEGALETLPDPPQPTRAQVESALARFVGVIEQRPPAYSAIKVGGKRSYQLARSGQAADLAPRPVAAYALTVQHYAYPELCLEITCSSGFYVRSLGRDLAAALGTAAVMSALRRTAIGEFRAADAAQLAEITAISCRDWLQPLASAVPMLPRVTLHAADLRAIGFGQAIADRPARPPSAPLALCGPAPASSPSPVTCAAAPDTFAAAQREELAAFNAAGALCAILVRSDGLLKPSRVFSPG